MIQIVDKKDCCGCFACVQKCPKDCITMYEDSEGFVYPSVDEALCIDCRICDKVCPVINQKQKVDYTTFKSFAAKNSDVAIKQNSSSGGIFTLIAETVIHKRGIVFGAKFDSDWEVIHDYTDSIEGLQNFRGSKYVQSRIENSYSKVEEFLKSGRLVLFTGAPCQIAGLNLFLRKDYPNLLTVDFICHGVPSPKVFRKYRDEVLANNSYNKNELQYIKFRDKTEGWEKFSLIFGVKEGNSNQIQDIRIPNNKDNFLRAFPENIFLRPSCHYCPDKALKSGADITIADYWGIKNDFPKFYDKLGVSLVIVGSAKGKKMWYWLNFNGFEVPIKPHLANPNLMKSAYLNPKREAFFEEIQNANNEISKIIYKYAKLSFKQKCKREMNHTKSLIRLTLKKVGLLDIIKKILIK